jgi:hypothetical protein
MPGWRGLKQARVPNRHYLTTEPWRASSGRRRHRDVARVRKPQHVVTAASEGGIANMCEGQIVALDEVKARWAFSEVASQRTRKHYRHLEDISAKIAAGYVSRILIRRR